MRLSIDLTYNYQFNKTCSEVLRIVLTLLFVLCGMTSYSQTSLFQKKEKRIYLLDITESMIGEGDGNGIVVFDSVKQCLKNVVGSLAATDPSIEIEVIPFSDKAYLNKAFKGFAGQKIQIFKYLDSLKAKGRSTNITNAWITGVGELDSTKINLMFILTDGKNNKGSRTEMYKTISAWNRVKCSDFCYAFYVALKDAVNDDAELRAITDTIHSLWWIHSMNVNVACMQPVNSDVPTLPVSEFRVNVHEKHTFMATFATNNGSFNRVADHMRQVCVKMDSNHYYQLSKSWYPFQIKNGTTVFPIEFCIKKTATEIPRDTVVPLTFSVVDTDMSFVFIVFTPERVNVRFVNRDENVMTFDPIGRISQFRYNSLRKMDFWPKSRSHRISVTEKSVRKMTFTTKKVNKKKKVRYEEY